MTTISTPYDRTSAFGRVDYRTPQMEAVVEATFVRETALQKEISVRNAEAGLPKISVGPTEGQLIEILLRASGAKRGVEIGTLGAYSTLWIAAALPADGKLISIERDPKHAHIARENIEKAGFSEIVEVRQGSAVDVLKELSDLSDLDFVFIDADKESYGIYAEWALPRLRKGGLILADNAYLWGEMQDFPKDLGSDKKSYRGMSDCWKILARPELKSLILPTGEGLGVGIKI